MECQLQAFEFKSVDSNSTYQVLFIQSYNKIITRRVLWNTNLWRLNNYAFVFKLDTFSAQPISFNLLPSTLRECSVQFVVNMLMNNSIRTPAVNHILLYIILWPVFVNETLKHFLGLHGFNTNAIFNSKYDFYLSHSI